MEYVVNGRRHAELFRFFEDICSIPHGSGNEAGVADYLCEFARERGLEYYRDGLNNVLIRKPASPGREKDKPVMLQAHTDMVCEKLPDSSHDFTRDPLKLKVNGDLLSADGTTLGADDGIGVAVMLYLLNDASLSAPALECLFTVSEETGMDGAEGFDYTLIRSRMLINLDNCGEGSACCGCAGGIRFDLLLPAERVPLTGKCVKVTLSGLAGGHSGVEIALGRRNAINMLASLLLSLYHDIPFCLVDMECMGKTNVIPSTASATVAFYDNAQAKEAANRLTAALNAARPSLCKADCGAKITVKNAIGAVNAENSASMCSFRTTDLLLSLLTVTPHGVIRYMPDDPTQVLSSVNPGVMSFDGSRFTVSYFARSCSDSENLSTISLFKGLARLYPDAGLSVISVSPGWLFKRGGELQDAYASACLEALGVTPKFDSIHAGLECGLITSSFNKIDGADNSQAISIGPDLYDIHSTKERVSLSSCERFCDLMTVLLARLG